MQFLLIARWPIFWVLTIHLLEKELIRVRIMKFVGIAADNWIISGWIANPAFAGDAGPGEPVTRASIVKSKKHKYGTLTVPKARYLQQ